MGGESEGGRTRSQGSNTSWVLKSRLDAPLGRPRAAPQLFFRLQEPPRALQEAPKSDSEAFRVEDAIRIPFWTHFWPPKETPGT